MVSKGQIQAENFIKTLYNDAKGGFISLWTLEDKKTRWFAVNQIDELIEEAIKLRDSHNVYFGVGVRKETLGEYKRGKNEDVLSLPGVWVEIDLKGGDHAAVNLPAEEDVQGILDTFPLEPSIVVHSGGGLHCYWLFQEPATIVSVKSMQSAERMLSRFQNVFIRLGRAKGFHIDNTADLARVLRVPGTYNLKSDPKPVTTELFEPEKRYSLSELYEAITSIEALFPEEPKEKAVRKQYDGELPDAKNTNRIVQECQYIRDYMEHQETANYKEWIAALSIAAYSENGEELVHEWSKGHSGYSEQEVDRKYTEIRSKMKPRTCQSIQQEFGKCNGCKHFNKINSPIALGMERKREKPMEQKNFKRTDLGNAERMVHRHGQNIRFNTSFGKWYLWDGKRWNEDKVSKVLQIAKDTVRAIYEEAAQCDDPDLRKSLGEHAMRSESRSRIESMVSLAKSEVPVLPDEMDKNIWAFNCENGVINLKNGELQPHSRDYMMTKISPVTYDASADCPTWKGFLNDIFQDEQGNIKQDTIDFLQKAVGYSLTGSTTEQVLFFLYGTGRNGKSTFMNVIKDILGDYGKQTNAETFTVKKSDRVNNDIAALKGARMVAATESEEGARLAESLVKQLTGGEPVQARFLHQEYFEYVPQFKIFFTTNHKPVIRGADEGIWRRIRLVPFTVRVPDEKLDKDLPEKLRNEMSGILRWMVEGCLKWQKEGLGVPQEVKDATDSYRDEMDTIGSFISDLCVVHENAKTLAADLYRQYGYWCQDNGEYEITKQKFNRKLEERGFKKGRDGRGIFLAGVGLRDFSNYHPSSFTKSEKVKSYEEKKTNSA
jgi:P4 family phage/plasmid primase-like protien